MLRSTLSPAGVPDVRQIEQAYAKAFDIPYAIWLPSARAGIEWALQSVLNSTGTVLCPAYNCRVVHDAVVRSGSAVTYIDSAPEGFLMDLTALAAASSGKYALVLSELYGLTYDLAALQSCALNPPAIRIFDMAMTVPTGPLLKRLTGNDFGVISFGLGKCFYAGWGGMGFTNDRALADEIRRRRDSCLAPVSLKLTLSRIVQIYVRTVVHYCGLYGIARILRRKPLAKEAAPQPPEQNSASVYQPPAGLPLPWKAPSTYLDRRLILYNLRHAHWHAELRLAQAARYHKNLQHVRGLGLPEHSNHPLSFYTIRVPAHTKKLIQDDLWQRKISTGTLFDPESHIQPEQFPNANRIAGEVLNLPINTTLKDRDIDQICQCVAQCASIHLPDACYP